MYEFFEMIKKDLTVLMIDDEIDLCVALSGFFKKENIEFVCAYSLHEGKIKLDECNPTVLLLDNNLPDGFGTDWLKIFKSECPRLKIILITANAIVAKSKETFLADKVLVKPTSFKEILQALKNLIV